MDRDALRTVAIAVLAVLVIAFAAATLDSTVTSDRGDSGISSNAPQDGAGGGQGEGVLPGEGREGTDLGEGQNSYQLCIEPLSDPAVAWGFLALLAVVYLVLRWRDLDRLSSLALVVTPAVPLVLLWMVLISGCRASNPVEASVPANFSFIPGDQASDLGSGGVVGDATGSATPSAPSVLLFAVLALGLVGVVVALFFVDRDDDEEEADPEPDLTEDEQRAAVAAAAGRAADRIEGAEDVDNEVYRAWAEMTTHLDVTRPETSTPAEFATAATDAGMSRADVDELTRLFEDVRYGGKDATEDRETRAVEALRRIEDQYGGDAP